MVTPTPGKRNFFYKNIEVTDVASFPQTPQVVFGFQATKVLISSDAENDELSFSFQRPYVDGELFTNDNPIALDWVGVGKAWFFYKVGAGRIRIWAWRI